MGENEVMSNTHKKVLFGPENYVLSDKLHCILILHPTLDQGQGHKYRCSKEKEDEQKWMKTISVAQLFNWLYLFFS